MYVLILDFCFVFFLSLKLFFFLKKGSTLPERRTLMLCREDSTWEDVLLMLLRWRHAKSVKEDKLFCLANADILPNEVLFSSFSFQLWDNLFWRLKITLLFFAPFFFLSSLRSKQSVWRSLMRPLRLQLFLFLLFVDHRGVFMLYHNLSTGS